MADDKNGELAGDDSPWAHDIPIQPAPPLPEAWTRAADVPRERTPHWPVDEPPTDASGGDMPGVDPTVHDPLTPQADTLPGPRPRRSVVIAGAIALIVMAVVVVRAVGGGNENDPTSASDDGAATTESDVSPSTSRPTTRPPKAPTTVVLTEADGRPTTVVDTLPEPEPEWIGGQIALAPRLSSMVVPTQIVVLNSEGVVHVIDAPTGAMRSIDTNLESANLAIAVGDDAIVVYSHSYSNEEVTLLNVGGDVHQVEIDGGTSQIVARPGTNDFLLASDDWRGNEPPPEILLAADGTTSEVTSGPSRDYGIWALRYMPATGDAVVNDSGGVYAIDREGLARRLSPGTLVAVGDNHVLARECDDALSCSYVRVDAVSGERTGVTAPDLEQYNGYDSSLSLSPDGTLMAYFDWLGSPLARRVLDFDAGTSAVVDSIDQYNSNTSWAADSSGLFIVENRQLVLYDRVTGEHVVAAPDVDLGNIVAVATRAVSG